LTDIKQIVVEKKEKLKILKRNSRTRRQRGKRKEERGKRKDIRE
jgi:hypothetical protein